MNPSLIFFVVAILIVGVLLFAVISATKKRTVILDTEKYQSRWLEIEQTLVKEDVKTYNLVVMEADKLLDHALKELGIHGKTFAEKLKNTSDMFTSINSVWHAHKLRNQVVHESGFKVNYDQARRALANFKQALKDVGAI